MAVYLGSDKVGVTKELGFDKLQWKCDNIKSLYYEFYDYDGENNSLQEVLKDLDTSQVESMNSTFYRCSKLTGLPSTFNTSNVTNMQNMFNYCSSMVTAPEIDLSNVTTANSMFSYCRKLKTVPKYNSGKVTNMSTMFSNCSVLETIEGLDLYSLTSYSQMFYGITTSIKNLYVYNVRRPFWGMTSFSNITVDSLINLLKELWDYSGTTTTYTMSLGATNQEKLANVYVKLVDVTDEMLAQDQYAGNKKPCVVCESTDEGAMTIIEYAISKNWAIS